MSINKIEKEKLQTIEIHDLIKIYKRKGVETAALRGLTCQMDKGKIVVLMGPSGCGKTTLLNILGGISQPSSGTVYVNGNLISEYSEKQLEIYRRDIISYIFQKKNLIPTMTVWDNIIFSVEYMGNYNEQNKQRIDGIIQFIGIDEKLKHFPDELSGGEQQRVALAAALAKNSPIILCDEPTGELDSQAKIRVMTLLTVIQEKYPEKLIIIVSHDPDFKIIADRVFYMRDGKISYEEQKDNLVEIRNQGLAEEMIGQVKSIIPKKNESAIQELRELANTITTRLSKLEQEDKKENDMQIEENV